MNIDEHIYARLQHLSGRIEDHQPIHLKPNDLYHLFAYFTKHIHIDAYLDDE